jgi:hypothetical protein
VSDDPSWPKAIINSKTWHALMSMGMRPNLTVDPNGYIVAFNNKYEAKRLARLIANANSDQTVRVKKDENGNRNECNLLEDNLEIIIPDPVTNDRGSFLSTEDGIFHYEVEYNRKPIPEPKLPYDAIAEAWSNNKHIQKGKTFN